MVLIRHGNRSTTVYETEKLYEYFFGEATVFCDNIEAKKKFSEDINI